MRIYNSLTRKIEPFRPLQNRKVGMYVCGMTVYDYCHLGHARVLVVFDMVARYLRACGYELTYVRNITDIDDKILRAAAVQNKEIDEFTGYFIEAMHEDERALSVLPPDLEPRATDHIDQIIDMVNRLMDNGFAYQGTNGDVYYRVRKFANYGQLSGELLDDLKAGARVEADESKDDPLDFVLWKAAKPGEPFWDSPWGAGRPGWHIECSAMSTHALGNHFDIHAGGMDLRFPHHENEIAQSEAATGEQFANVWMHIGHLRIDEQKMSKSLGNFVTIRELLTHDNNKIRMGEVMRLLLLSSHYRSPMHYSDEALENSKSALTRLYLTLERIDKLSGDRSKVSTKWADRFCGVMDEDFNTPEALACLFELGREVNKSLDRGEISSGLGLGAELRRLAEMLGLLFTEPNIFLGSSEVSADQAGVAEQLRAEEVRSLISQREKARDEKRYQDADRVREKLDDYGIIVEDGPSGTSWRRK